MTDNYYYFIPNCYEKEAGSIDTPDLNKCPEIYDAEQVKINDDFVYELQDGKYCAFDRGPIVCVL